MKGFDQYKVFDLPKAKTPWTRSRKGSDDRKLFFWMASFWRYLRAQLSLWYSSFCSITIHKRENGILMHDGRKSSIEFFDFIFLDFGNTTISIIIFIIIINRIIIQFTKRILKNQMDGKIDLEKNSSFYGIGTSVPSQREETTRERGSTYKTGEGIQTPKQQQQFFNIHHSKNKRKT